MACNNRGCGNNSNWGGCGCNRPERRNCSRLARDVYDLIEKLEANAEELERAWDALEDRGCIRETRNQEGGWSRETRDQEGSCNGNRSQSRNTGCGCR